MAQLYARIFLQILDSSIAEDFTMRHVFEDFLKLAYEGQHGVVDMTRQALSRRLNLPLEVLNDAISKLEAPDPNSRDPDNGGRRIAKLDDHRDWGWKILNWHKFDEIKRRADVADRVAKHRRKSKPTSTRSEKPTLEQVKLQCAKIGLPETEAEGFINYYESNGWKVGRNAMQSWTHALSNWKKNWHEKNTGTNQKRVDRNKGTLNEGTAHLYKAKPVNPPS